jgi:hypothetical protein
MSTEAKKDSNPMMVGMFLVAVVGIVVAFWQLAT